MTQYDLFGPPTVEPTAPPTLTPRARGHQAAEASAAKADTVIEDWTEQACQHVTEFARKALVNGDNPWLMEDARDYAEGVGLPAPPDKRAWGAVAMTLARRGVITCQGWGAADSSNGSAKRLWRAAW